ncbi:Flp pilus assembly protein CpaB [Paraburkholderia rhynchosiae]|uniref:Flp pilus assembly protein CpaB n=1 Tax=Paraburkholderia rhynchosiae TaxID=487049 RepID=A0A2N7WK10_9BURK|nr:Flp pilus assembly protein CpaB [Paraburkholderia rhynchosiae]PMS29768.1 Flp pilus assembly protein CpaB [Paraburkholderia rhynchosiae]CAB3698018.1 hypothetical protein LMG27174_03517 [Paraburkholderia rhynchosiae]
MLKLTRIAAGALIALALLLGLFAVTLLRRPAPAPVTSFKQAVFPVVVATRVLPAGKPIAVDALRVQPLPINPNGAFADPSLLVGRLPAADIGAESPVLEQQLSSGLAERIEAGERAVAVPVEESNAVGNRLRPGNFVDVFFTLKRDGNLGSGAEVDRTQARLLMSKVRVLAFGNATAGGDTSGEPNGVVRTAVLAVPVADVDRLALAETSGRLVFALRNPKDAEVTDVDAFAPLPAVLKTSTPAGAAVLQDSTRAAAGVSLDALSGGGANAAPRTPSAPRPAPPPSRIARNGANAGNAGSAGGAIEVIRGGRAETVAR